MPFDWGKFNKTIKKKFGGKKKATGKKSGTSGKGNAWTAYVSGAKKR